MATVMQWCGGVARRAMVGQRSALFSTSSAPLVSSGAAMAPILCGRGDKKTKRGKRFKGTYGNARPKKDKKIERIKDKVEVPRVSRADDFLQIQTFRAQQYWKFKRSTIHPNKAQVFSPKRRG
ncbi:unnamed protein product [Dovyalis caffra]|uniref:30S ribosomal protein S31, mitochondrial n=1 Tax=Dovyalis caffra TaxID=77055 RepID=A0AAV1R9B9_9ROSI|nr:unnamed protein product [Dovyalis caffra]